MAERMTQSWTTVPHSTSCARSPQWLVEMRARLIPAVEKRVGTKPTYTDLLVKLVAAALVKHPRVNASWIAGVFS